MKTLLVIAPGTGIRQDCVFNLLVAETGEHLASHLCSHYLYAKNDLYDKRRTISRSSITVNGTRLNDSFYLWIKRTKK